MSKKFKKLTHALEVERKEGVLDCEKIEVGVDGAAAPNWQWTSTVLRTVSI